MNELLKKTLSLGIGIASVSKEMLEQYVGELVKRGEIAPAESKDLMSQLVQRGEQEQTELKRIIQEQVRKVLVELNMSTKDDIARLETRIHKLEQQLSPPNE